MTARIPVLLQPRTASSAIVLTIHGEPASKANSREIVTRRYRDEAGKLRTRPQSIKSDKARDYERAALLQIPAACRVRLTGPVRVTLRIWYASERPDLDESVVLDVLQDRYARADSAHGKPRTLVQPGVYRNDRQVREKHVFHAIDRANPRAEVIVEPMTAQQSELQL
jgi:hypothetical protein